MRNLKIGLLVTLCILLALLCGIFAYGMTGHNIYRAFQRGYDDRGYIGMHLVLEKEVPMEGIDSISIFYSKNSNDIYLYEGQGDVLAIKEYNEFELNENELSTVSVNGSRIEVKGKKRSRMRAGFFHFGYGGGYTEVWLPASYKGELALATSSGDITSEMDLVLERDLSAASTSGEITMPDVTAGNVSLASTSGNVGIETIETEKNGTAGDINIATTSGDITVKQLVGETNIVSTSGYVNAETITGNAQIATTSGDVTIDGADGLWQIYTTSGEVRVKGQNDSGTIETTSGDVNLEIVELNGALDINTSSGSVNMKLSQDSAFDFSAETTSGNIDTFFDDDLKFSKKGNSAQGTHGQNPQGNSIRIGTTSGDVRIMKY